MTDFQKEMIQNYEEDVLDSEKDVKDAQQELDIAQDWLNKRRILYAENIIKLNNYKKNHEKKTNI
jgi:hypothetical protein